VREDGTGNDSRNRQPPDILATGAREIRMPRLPRRLATGLLAAALLAPAARSQGTSGGFRLFKVVGLRDEVIIGVTEAELQRLGSGPAVERIARALIADGRLTAWRYVAGRAPDGGTRFAPQGQVAILRNDALRIDPYTAALPAAPPPEP
jgi:hypothetical protein